LEEAGVEPWLLKRTNYIKAKGFVEDIEYFDASFFDYTPREARIMDPQIRLLHECAWEALENAGYDPATYKGLIGFYAGASFNVNWLAQFSRDSAGSSRMEAGSLCYKDSVSTLISYKLNLKGPSLTLYTACSTSLVAIHQACRGLLTGECHMALAGGASVSIPKKGGYLYEPGMIFSSDGHCRVFDANAGGTVFSDGAGIVALKRLEDAIDEGDHIYAVVKASAVNNDGLRKTGYAAPSIEGQEEVVRAALHMAEVEPESITYIEAHGTGTTLGDAIEMEALMRVFNTGKTKYCAVGSVKTNIGHLDVAAGAAGFIKTVLALTCRLIPPTLHFKTPNLEIDFENSAFYVNTKPIPWENDAYPVRAGVSASGIGGTNAHVILEEAPISVSSEMSRSHHLLVLSARSEFALERATVDFAAYLKKHPGINLADAAYTLQVGRRAFARRRAIVCRDVKDSLEILDRRHFRSFFSGEHIDRSVIFMFPGQGTQYSYMAWELYTDEPVFREHLDKCAEIVESISGIDLIDAIYPRARSSSRNGTRLYMGNGGAGAGLAVDPLAQPQVGQLALVAIEYALARLWMAWGVKPRGMIGHSVGEYVVACLSGVFTLENMLQVVWIRGRLMQELPEGGMVAVVLGEKKIRPLLGNNLWLAAVNTPSLCVVSGTITAIRRLQKQLTSERIPCIPLKTLRAFHSGMLDDILEPFARVMEQVPLHSPQIPFVSGVTGEWITSADAMDPGYWVKHLRQPVHFSRGVQELLREPNRILLEVGPGDTLKRLVKHHIRYEDRRRMFTSLRRSDEVESDTAFLLKTLGQLWVTGVIPDWVNFYAHENRHRVPLPSYPFERERYWFEEKQKPREEDKTPAPVEIVREPAPHHHPRPGLSVEYMPPKEEIEKIIVTIWEELFGIRPIGIHDNFFELGGHSLNATIVTSRIHRELDVNIPLKEVFAHPTIRQLTRYVEAAAREVHAPVEPVEKQEYYPLSSAQKRLFFLWQLDKQSTAYNMPVVRVVEGKVDRKKCEETFKKLIQRHESLRTSCHIIESIPVQKVHEDVVFTVEYDDPGGKGLHVTGLDIIINDFICPFDLSCAPPLRVRLVKLSEKRHLLLFDMHHIVSDGTSMNIIVKEYMALYGGETLSPLRINCKDFVQWQAKHKESDALKRQEAYWKKEFAGEIPLLNLPVDYARNCSAVPGMEGSSVDFEIDRQETRAVSQLAAAGGATLFMVLLSIFNVLLAKLSGQQDIIVGSPIAGRRHVDLQHIIGIFINTLALRSSPTPGKSFKDFLGDVRDRVLQDFENQDFQFEDLVEKTAVNYSWNRNPLFDVMFVLQNTGMPEIEMSGLKLKPYHFKNRASKFDLTLTAVEVEGILHFRMQYRTRLFKEESIHRFIKYFKKIISTVTRHPELKISEVEIITEEEKEQVLRRFNQSYAAYPKDKPLHQLFEEQVNRTPNHIAVITKTREAGCREQEDIEPQTKGIHMAITYRELHRKSNQLAHLLRKKGIRPDTIAAIIADRSIGMVVGVLAILKAGAAYLPIDLQFPLVRIRFLLEDSQPQVILIQAHLYDANKEALEAFSSKDILPIEPGRNFLGDDTSLAVINRPEDLAYVIYTSGTAGKPKGVMVDHNSAVNVVSWFGRRYRLKCGVHILRMSDYTFDASVNQVFGALLHGATVHEINRNLTVDIDGLRDYIDTYRVHIINYVPIFLNQLLNYGPKLESLRTVISGAETLNDVTREKILGKGYELHNHYGPTEATIDTLASRCSDRKVTLGTPISNIRCYILDKCRNLVPVGVAGELYIAGVGLSRGYLNSPLLTAEKFVHLSFLPEQRLYRSGDLVRWLANGDIEFLGRIDEQVKIRGCRVELGEIRNQLLAIDFITEAVVSEVKCFGGNGYGGHAGEKYLCAYIVSEQEVHTAELKKRLSNRLPAYMLPSYFIQVDRIPLTAAGKLDHKALPEPEDWFSDRYTPPTGKIEETLVELWADILARKKEIIGRDTNFFELGGHSLKATLLVSRIHQVFDVKLSLQEIFTMPRVKELACRIQAASGEQYRAVEPAEKKSYYALSSAQKRLYVLQKMDETGTAYNMLTVMVLEGVLDREKLERVFVKLIQRHESLRTSFELIEGTPVQKLHERAAFKIEYWDPGDRGQESGNRVGRRCDTDPVGSFLEVEEMIRDFVRPFDLSQAPLLRVGLIMVEEGRHMLMVDMHHIISDGVSVERFVNEFMTLYAGGKLPALKLQYKDYAQWQDRMRPQQAESLKRQGDYWKSQFRGEIPFLQLPTDYPRPKLYSFEGSEKHFRISSKQVRALNKMALEEGVTLYMVLLAIYGIFLSRLTGQEDIVIGTPTAGRRHADLQHIIGMFVNTLAVRNYPSGKKTVKSFLQELRQRTLEAFENQDYHFEDLVDKLAITRDVGRNPLFDTMFTFQNLEIPQIELPQLKLTPYPFERGTSLFDLSVVAKEREGRLIFTFEYNTKLFKQETIHRFSCYFEQLLAVVPYSREKEISQVDLMSPEEREQVLLHFNETAFAYPGTMTVHGLFEQQAARVPDRIAVFSMEQHLTYKKLDEKSHLLAGFLQARGVTPGCIVGIMVRRSVGMLIGILAILKAGAAYMPIDPAYPIDRKQFMLKDCNARILLSEDRGAAPISGFNKNIEVIDLTGIIGPIGPIGPILFKELPTPPTQCCYIIYTSGSTGRPKGVMVEHRAVMNRLYWVHREYRLDNRDVVLQKTPFIFDVSVCELFRWIPGGGKVLLLPEDGEKDPEIMVKIIEMHHLTTIDFVPTMLNIFLDYIHSQDAADKAATLRWVFVGVEAVDSKLVKKFNKILYAGNGTQLVNAYGPTETTVDITTYNCSPGEIHEIVPIGKPMGNTRIYILDKYGNPQPIGVVGELYIEGHSVSRGYLNNPELTNSKFQAPAGHPLSFLASQLLSFSLYRTGDLARWLPDGHIEFIGRIDYQVKIRGFRIELGEIENRLLMHQQVRETVVLPRANGKGFKYLYAYIVPSTEAVDVNELKEYLSSFLPDYMIPSRFVLMEEIPLTPTGKIDRRALPEPQPLEDSGKQVVGPETEEEEILLEVWADVLGLQRPGPEDNFFELGGDSIKAIQVVARLRDRGFALQLTDLFLNPCIRELAAYIRKTGQTLPDEMRDTPDTHAFTYADLTSEELDELKKKVGELK
jgi:amino acid adenylation domain-containing protein